MKLHLWTIHPIQKQIDLQVDHVNVNQGSFDFSFPLFKHMIALRDFIHKDFDFQRALCYSPKTKKHTRKRFVVKGLKLPKNMTACISK